MVTHGFDKGLKQLVITRLSLERSQALGNYKAWLRALSNLDREEATRNEGCRRELGLFHKWRTKRETIASETHLYCNINLTVNS